MREKTIFASLVTLLFMAGFVFATLTGLALAATDLNILVALAIGVGTTGAWSILMWLVSPWIMDLMQAWIYQARRITIEELEEGVRAPGGGGARRD